MPVLCILYIIISVVVSGECDIEPKSSQIKYCLAEIRDRYFFEFHTATIFTTDNRDLLDTGIYSLQQISLKLKNFSSFEVDFKEHFKQIGIIQTIDLNEILNNEKQLSKLALWNSRAKFVFISTRNNSESVLNKFVRKMWHIYIINMIIMSPVNKEIVNIYSYFPYKNGNCGTNVFHELIEVCEDGKLKNEENLFPDKLPAKLNNCVLKIQVIIWTPYILTPPEGIQDYNNITFQVGIEIELISLLAKALNLTVVYSTSKKPQDWGVVTPNGTATGAMGNVMMKKVDMAVGIIGASIERNMFLDYSISHLQEALTFCVPKAQLSPRWRSLLDVFQTTTWLYITVSYLVVGSCVWFFCYTPPRDQTSFVKLHYSLYYAYSIFLSVSAHESPRKLTGRMGYILWIFFSLHFAIAYQAKLMSLLAHPGFERQMNSVEEMLDSNIPLTLLPTLLRFFANDDDWKVKKILKTWSSCLDSEKCLNRIAYQRNLALFTTKIHMDFEKLQYVDSNGDPLIHCFDSYLTYPSELFMTMGFPLRDRMDSLIIKIKDAGLIFKWRADMERLWKGKFGRTSEGGRDMPLTISHLEGAFFISVIGWTVAFVVFLTEIVVEKITKKKILN